MNGRTKRDLYRGEWWNPHTPGTRSPGTLYATENRLELQLLHALTEPLVTGLGEFPVIHGEARPLWDGAGIKSVKSLSLFRAFDTHVRPGPSQHAGQRLLVNAVVAGEHYASEDDLLISSLTIESDALDRWVPHSLVFPRPQGSAPPGRASDEVVNFRLPRGVGGGLHVSLSTSANREGRTYTESDRAIASFGISPPMRLGEATARIADPLAYLLTLAFGAPTPHRSITAIDAAEGIRGSRLTVLYPQVGGGVVSAKDRDVYPSRVPVLPCPETAAEIRALIEGWYGLLEDTEIRQAAVIFAETIGHPHLYMENRLLGSTASAEGLHRAQYGDHSLGSREHRHRVQRVAHATKDIDEDVLDWLLPTIRPRPRYTLRDRLGTLLGASAFLTVQGYIKDAPSFFKAVGRTRDAIAHGLMSPRLLGADRGTALLQLATQVNLLVASEFMRLLGVDAPRRAATIGASHAGRTCRRLVAT